MINARHHFAAGDRDAYQSQGTFEFAEDPKLSALVLPPELDLAVYVFHRK